MRTFTTCPGCGDVLAYQDRRTRTHPGCQDPQGYEFELEREFLAAAEAGDNALADTLAAQLDGMFDRPPRLFDAALAYAEMGWPVFPLRPGTKIPFPNTRGFKDATDNRILIRQWWGRWPMANIGLPTGRHFDVIDIDFRHGARPAWDRLRAVDAMPDVHGVASTAHNGIHLLLEPAGGGNLTRAGALPGIDYRGRGGYIVAPPSILASGRRYTWEVKPSPVITAPRRPVPTRSAGAP
ncbi:Bifunctional DNA primase/polymerase, N-terminal [Amycolatopsis pretoriensis]|uniref:Bifunctional DNA primase/polymerase, N-terminal n=1 Tax=Amycolatopsis pretoriensis TaxID=218821 RepID=A0A1H5RAC2_9PSEU|nr:bifunctional DNA primase/polymerase [Amycolatopsis pretoriensis]SEF34357.1 Bifunctional DNA primase/polymerase, N-terminal [Amycolatopsis pretoriensis]